MKGHETDLRTLMYEMVEFQQRRQLPPSETARQWSEMGKPIFRDARKAILDGNKEWREVLDEKQRARHDQDLDLLNRHRMGLPWGTTVVVVSHSLPQLTQLCPRSIWLHHGELVMDGVPADRLWPMLVGGAAAAVTGYLAIGFLLSRLKTGTFKPYAIYRLVLAAVLLVALVIL